MKTTLSLLALSAAIAGSSHAAIALTGTAVTGFAGLAPVNTLVLLVADSGTAGILGAPGLSGDLTAANDPQIAIANASITTGSTFGGDLVLGQLPVTSAGAIPGGFTFDNVASLQGKSFALLFFPTLTTASVSVPNGTPYGVISGSDWVLPAVNGGESFSFSATDSLGTGSFFRVTVASGVATNDNFTTSTGAVFTAGTAAVPEPSAALLGAIGALGLLRRRRN